MCSITHDHEYTNKQKDMEINVTPTKTLNFIIPENSEDVFLNNSTLKLNGLETKIQELKRLQLEINEYNDYCNWYTSEAWSRDMTLDEAEKSNMLYEQSNKNTARIAEIILNEL